MSYDVLQNKKYAELTSLLNPAGKTDQARSELTLAAESVLRPLAQISRDMKQTFDRLARQMGTLNDDLCLKSDNRQDVAAIANCSATLCGSLAKSTQSEL